MTERETLAERIATALDDEVPGLHPCVSDKVARVAARVAIENLSLVVGAMPEDLMPQTRPNLTVVEDPETP